ncbi:hypothetical protein EI94DRAFT_1757082 [Lactarius quietus]|nr:hypothetical protein EI94DRAFT_1757082 [Lactarius quietus]
MSPVLSATRLKATGQIKEDDWEGAWVSQHRPTTAGLWATGGAPCRRQRAGRTAATPPWSR